MIYAPCVGGLPGVILDGGMRELSERLEKVSKDITSVVLPWFLWKRARDEAIALFRAGKLEYVIYNGHSWGCLKGIQFASDLAKHGIKVRLMGAFDPTALPLGAAPMAVPENVEEVIEIWATFPSPPAWARFRDRTGGRGGMYQYPHDTPRELKKFAVSHIAVGSYDPAHELILQRAKEIIG
jgi:hypothetical protein